MDANLNSLNFYNWFLNIGGEMSNIKVDIVESSVNRIPLIHANLKSRASEIKEKYNHKFVINHQHEHSKTNRDNIKILPKEKEAVTKRIIRNYFW